LAGQLIAHAALAVARDAASEQIVAGLTIAATVYVRLATVGDRIVAARSLARTISADPTDAILRSRAGLARGTQIRAGAAAIRADLVAVSQPILAGRLQTDTLLILVQPAGLLDAVAARVARNTDPTARTRLVRSSTVFVRLVAILGLILAGRGQARELLRIANETLTVLMLQAAQSIGTRSAGPSTVLICFTLVEIQSTVATQGQQALVLVVGAFVALDTVGILRASHARFAARTAIVRSAAINI
jgi:hypothetical protein